MSKRKERVTNEQALIEAHCSGSCYNCDMNIQNGACPIVVSRKDYAQDLLDARIERGKAIAMMREARGVANSMIEASQNEDPNVWQDSIAALETFIEKTKEYAV
jgi:Trk K+ transport system NAD-binding subunit